MRMVNEDDDDDDEDDEDDDGDDDDYCDVGDPPRAFKQRPKT